MTRVEGENAGLVLAALAAAGRPRSPPPVAGHDRGGSTRHSRGGATTVAAGGEATPITIWVGFFGS